MCLARRAEWIRPFVGPSACVRASTTRTPLVHHGMRPAVLGLVVVASACGAAGAPATRDDGAQPVAAQPASEAVTSGVPPVDPTSAPPANTPAVGETGTRGPPVPPPPGASPATIAPLLRERIGPADARVAPPGTLESHVEFFQRIPVTVNDRGPVGGVANTGLHADRLSLGTRFLNSRCRDALPAYSVARGQDVSFCFRAVHRRIDEQVRVHWLREGRLVRRSQLPIPAIHAYRTRARLALRREYVGRWEVVALAADDTEIARAAFEVIE